jgi:hypothetical protein
MPYVDPRLRNCAIYLYPSVQMAQDGANFGGTGFVVGVPSSVLPEGAHLYAVTNEHVVRPRRHLPNPIIRLTETTGKTDILNVESRRWLAHPHGDDLAATPLILADDQDVYYINRNDFLTREDIDRHRVGPGDECFMAGRQIYCDGKQRNEPVLRGHAAPALPFRCWRRGIE